MIVYLVVYGIYALLLSPIPLLLWAWYRVFAASQVSLAGRSFAIATGLVTTFSYGLPFTLMFVDKEPSTGRGELNPATFSWMTWFLWICIAASAAAAVASALRKHPARVPLLVASIDVAFAWSFLLVLRFALLILPHD